MWQPYHIAGTVGYYIIHTCVVLIQSKGFNGLPSIVILDLSYLVSVLSHYPRHIASSTLGSPHHQSRTSSLHEQKTSA